MPRWHCQQRASTCVLPRWTTNTAIARSSRPPRRPAAARAPKVSRRRCTGRSLFSALHLLPSVPCDPLPLRSLSLDPHLCRLNVRGTRESVYGCRFRADKCAIERRQRVNRARFSSGVVGGLEISVAMPDTTDYIPPTAAYAVCCYLSLPVPDESELMPTTRSAPPSLY